VSKIFIPKPSEIDDFYSNIFFKYFNHILKKKLQDKFILAVSGGADSMLLLYLFCKYFPNARENIIIGHVNHNVRESSEKDEKFIKNIGEYLNIRTIVKHLEPSGSNKKTNSESWLREARYKSLNEILKYSNSDWIVTAHHSNDQAETVLMNLANKSGLVGMSGMNEINNNIIRPLLNFSKSDIVKVIAKYKIPFLDDSTNFDNTFNRNFIRNEIIAKWQTRNKNIIDGIITSVKYFKEYQTSLLFFINDFIDKNSHNDKQGNLFIIISELKKIPLLAQIMAFQVLTNSIGIFRKHDLLKMKEFLIKGKVGSIFKTKNDFSILYDRKFILIKKNKSLKNSYLDLKIGKKGILGNYSYLLSKNNNYKYTKENINQELIDFDMIRNKKIKVRYWQPGDSFQPLGMMGTQKVSDLLINKKVNMFTKSNQTVLTADDRIIWVCGHMIDNSVRLNIDTKNIIKLERFNLN